jgi:hypothetical protein
MRPSPALVLAFLALVVSVTGAAYAAIPANDGDIHACYSKATGAIELVDTQKDKFACEKNWKGLVIDTEPTQLVSPDGKFVVEATNSGARLKGAGSLVEISPSQITITSPTKIDVKSAGVVSIRGSQIQENKRWSEAR